MAPPFSPDYHESCTKRDPDSVAITMETKDQFRIRRQNVLALTFDKCPQRGEIPLFGAPYGHFQKTYSHKHPFIV